MSIGALQMKIALGFVLNRVSKYIIIIIIIIILFINIIIRNHAFPIHMPTKKNTFKIHHLLAPKAPRQGDCPMKPPGAVRSLADGSR